MGLGHRRPIVLAAAPTTVPNCASTVALRWQQPHERLTFGQVFDIRVAAGGVEPITSYSHQLFERCANRCVHGLQHVSVKASGRCSQAAPILALRPT